MLLSLVLIFVGVMSLGSSICLLDDETYDRLLKAIDTNELVPYSHTCPMERRVHDMQLEYACSIEQKFDLLDGNMEILLLVNTDGKNVIFPRKARVTKIIDVFYKIYKGEGARKLHKRILLSYAGITRNDIQTFINENPEHCRKNPIFANKPPLQPVVSHTPNNRHQIDLVSFEKDPQVKDGKVYSYALSVLDVFSRYVFLRPTTSKEPKEVKEILNNIYPQFSIFLIFFFCMHMYVLYNLPEFGSTCYVTCPSLGLRVMLLAPVWVSDLNNLPKFGSTCYITCPSLGLRVI